MQIFIEDLFETSVGLQYHSLWYYKQLMVRLSTQAIENKKNQEISSGTTETRNGGVDESFKNLLTVAKLAKSKKSKLTKPKKSDLIKVHFFGTDFLIFGAKKTFIYL